MSADPEPILAALFSWLVAHTTGFETTGRRIKPWDEVNAQPALFLRHIGTTDAYDGTLQETTLDCEVWIYSRAGQNPDAVPDTALNALVQSVRNSFIPDADPGDPNDVRFTIAGLAYWCRVEGESYFDPGDITDQAIARIPVKITLP